MDAPPQEPPDRKPPRRPTPGRVAAVVVAVAAAVAAFYGLYWSFVAERFEAGIAAWVEARAADGYRVSTREVRVTGFPFRIRAVIAEPAVATFSGRRPWSWRGPALTLSARPWRPSRLRLGAPGRHWLVAEIAGRAREFTIDVRELTLKLRLAAGGPSRAALSARGVSVTDGAGAAVAGVAAAEIIARRPGTRRPGAKGPAPALDLVVEAADVTLPREPVPGLGAGTARTAIRAAVTGALPAVLSGAALRRWRDDGGTIEIRHLGLRHGPIDASGDGTMALDDDMQPIGAFTLRVRGFADALDALERAGAVEPRAAALARAALSQLADKEDGGIDVPVSVQDRRFYVGPLPLARLPAVRWP